MKNDQTLNQNPQPCPPCPTLPTNPGQGGTTHLAPIPVGGQVGAGFTPPQNFAFPGGLKKSGQGSGQGSPPPHLFQLEAITGRRRAARKTTCPSCGKPTWTGPDDDPSGPVTEIVTLAIGRLTRLGMYQAATAGRAIYVLHSSKAGAQIDWLGQMARPNPDRDHLLATHDCDLPALDTRPDSDIAATLNSGCPF